MEKNYYDILGVSKDASKDDIRKAFKKLSVKYHPDKHINDSEEDKQKAEDKFKEINEAYEVLSDDQKRQEYDNPMSGFENMFGGFNPFSDFFTRGRHQNFIRPGQDIRVNINLTIEDFYKGGTKEIKYKKNIRCGHCDGDGGKTKICTHCNGTGTIQKRYQQGNMISVHTEQCPHCQGQGKHIIETCNHCSGTGFIKEDKTFNFNINQLNPVMSSGDYVIDNFGGHESKQPGGQDGTLIARIIIDLKNYKVGKNNDVFEQVEIPYYDMLLGVDKDIILPNGKKIVVTIPEESRDGNMIISKGNGIKGADYYLCIKPRFPFLEKNDKELLKKIKKNH